MQNVYLITGATGDIGISLLKKLYKEEDIFICQGYTDIEKLSSFAEGKNNINVYDINLANKAMLEKFICEIMDTLPTLTHFVHLPALRVINTKFKNFDDERFETDLDLQLNSAIAISKAFLPEMAKAKYGRCLFMLTNYVLGLPPKNTTAYIVAKSAMQGLVKSLAVDFAPFGITVNAVAPSMVETGFLAETSNLIIEAAAAAHPMKRNATPDDVTPAMAFLLSEQARFITGITLPITGGSNI
ncbi:MAG: SDR family oxidoreductase [Oscillospiraceae bacterium]